ncbi:hypothetical protein H0H93_010553 [Arthromyces matolae]|nr:hypothetical protein H0H93_010553 [Arthromyces matolae]
MENLLYEIIVITHFETIPRVLNLLREVLPGRQQGRGHACRRLDIHISIRLDQKSEYLDEAWDVGRNTLWGLIAACPNLQVLTARTTYTHPNRRNFFLLPHIGHNALCKEISTHCARTLRRLELSGFDIPMDRIEMMLRYLSQLEAFSISDCRPFNNIRNKYRRKYFNIDFDEPREYDENEEEQIFGINSEYTRKSKSYGKFRKKSRLVKSTQVFSDRMIKDLYGARDHAQWPPFEGSPPYQVPKLHTLHVDKLTDRIFELDLPCLRFFSIDEVLHPHIMFNTTLVPDVQNSSASTSTLSSLENSERPSKYDLHPKYRHLANGPYYTNPIPHSTPFGIFPSTITHLTIAYPMNFARILYFFPNITDLTLYIERAFDSTDETPHWKPHRNLQHIIIRNKDWGVLSPVDTKQIIQQVVRAVSNGWLLSLIDLVLALRPQSLWCSSGMVALQFEECKRLGIQSALVDVGEVQWDDVHSYIYEPYKFR